MTRPPAARNPATWLFAAVFASAYFALYLGYCTVPDSFLRDKVYFYGIVAPSKSMINWLAPAEHVMGEQNRLQSPTARLNIVRGCDGSGVAFLLIAAIVALRSSLRRSLFGAIGAVALVYVLNQMRIVTLYFVQTRMPAWFIPMHVYFVPTLMILIAAIYFFVWTAYGTHDGRSAAEA